MNKVREIVHFSQDRNRPVATGAPGYGDSTKLVTDYIEQNPGTSALQIIKELPTVNGKNVYSVLYRLQRNAKLKSRKLDGLVRWYPESYLFPEEIKARKELAAVDSERRLPYKEQVVLTYVKSKPGTRQNDMASRLGYATGAGVAQFVRDLIALGLIEWRGKGRGLRLFPTNKTLEFEAPATPTHMIGRPRNPGLPEDVRQAREAEALTFIAIREGESFSVGDIHRAKLPHLKGLSYSTTFQLVRRLETEGKIVRRDFKYYLAPGVTIDLPLEVPAAEPIEIEPTQGEVAAKSEKSDLPYIAITLRGVIKDYLYEQARANNNPNYLPDFINYVEEKYRG